MVSCMVTCVHARNDQQRNMAGQLWETACMQRDEGMNAMLFHTLHLLQVPQAAAGMQNHACMQTVDGCRQMDGIHSTMD